VLVYASVGSMSALGRYRILPHLAPGFRIFPAGDKAKIRLVSYARD